MWRLLSNLQWIFILLPRVFQDRKLKEIMSQNGLLQIDGKQYVTKIDEMELVGDLVNLLSFRAETLQFI